MDGTEHALQLVSMNEQMIGLYTMVDDQLGEGLIPFSAVEDFNAVKHAS